MVDKNDYTNSRLLVVFILTFASIVDLVPPLVMGDGFLSIGKVFLVLGVLFVTQHAFKWSRVILIILVAVFYVFRLMSGSSFASLMNGNLIHTLFASAAIPLYVVIFLISVSLLAVSRKYKIFK